jgi:hypothetical protein
MRTSEPGEGISGAMTRASMASGATRAAQPSRGSRRRRRRWRGATGARTPGPRGSDRRPSPRRRSRGGRPPAAPRRGGNPAARRGRRRSGGDASRSSRARWRCGARDGLGAIAEAGQAAGDVVGVIGVSDGPGGEPQLEEGLGLGVLALVEELLAADVGLVLVGRVGRGGHVDGVRAPLGEGRIDDDEAGVVDLRRGPEPGGGGVDALEGEGAGAAGPFLEEDAADRAGGLPRQEGAEDLGAEGREQGLLALEGAAAHDGDRGGPGGIVGELHVEGVGPLAGEGQGDLREARAGLDPLASEALPPVHELDEHRAVDGDPVGLEAQPGPELRGAFHAAVREGGDQRGQLVDRDGEGAVIAAGAPDPRPVVARRQVAQLEERRAAAVEGHGVASKFLPVEVDLDDALGAGRQQVEEQQPHHVAAFAVERPVAGDAAELDRRRGHRRHGDPEQLDGLGPQQREHPRRHRRASLEEPRDPREPRRLEGLRPQEQEPLADLHVVASAARGAPVVHLNADLTHDAPPQRPNMYPRSPAPASPTATTTAMSGR